MRIDVITLFPEMFAGVLSESILRIGREKGLIDIRLHNLRDFTVLKHKKVDDRPFGGGPGMVLMAAPVYNALKHLEDKEGLKTARKIMLTPQGRTFSQKIAEELSVEQNLIMLCGHYEGFDERITELFGFDEISVGDYVLSGGELPAMTIIDAVSRLVPGVLGNPLSAEQDSFSANALDFPQYTRPETFRGLKVPDVLLSGDHKKIAEWRRRQAEQKTLQKRGDLLK